VPAIAADAGVVMVAIIAILVVLAVYFLLQAIIAFAQWAGIPNLPLIGGSIMNALRTLAGWVSNVAAWLWQHANPVTIITASVHWLMGELNTVNAWVLQNVVGAIDRTVTQTIPSFYNASVTLAWTLYNDARAFVVSEINAVRLTIATDIATAEAIASIAVTDARLFSVQLYNDALAFTDAAVKAAEAQAVGLVQTLQGWAVAEFTQLRTWVTGEIGTAVQGVEGDIRTAVQGVENTLSPEIAAAAAAAAAAASVFAKWRADCGDPLCTNLSGFGNIISAIEGIVTDGALVALIVGAVADPAGTVNVIEQDFAAPVTAAVDTVLGAVGFSLQRAA